MRKGFVAVLSHVQDQKAGKLEVACRGHEEFLVGSNELREFSPELLVFYLQTDGDDISHHSTFPQLLHQAGDAPLGAVVAGDATSPRWLDCLADDVGADRFRR